MTMTTMPSWAVLPPLGCFQLYCFEAKAIHQWVFHQNRWFFALCFLGLGAVTMLSFLRRTLGRRSIRKHTEKSRFREAQRATTHIPAAGEAKSVITCRVSLLDGTDVSVDLPVSMLALANLSTWAFGHWLWSFDFVVCPLMTSLLKW